MSAIRTYRSVHGRGGRTLRTVRVGNWLHWSPFNERPRLIIKVGGRKFVFSDQAVFNTSWSTEPRLDRLATGFKFHLGRLRFVTIAAR